MKAYTITCTSCQQPQVVSVKEEDLARWRAGEFVQKAMPYLTADERELFISGTCGTCWDELFPPEPEETCEFLHDMEIK